MAPKPIEDVDFPALSDQILELLRSIWDFICNICLVIWSYVSEAFLAVWTYPPFETLRNEFVATLVALRDYAAAHPIKSTAIVILAIVVVRAVYKVLKVFLLYCLVVVPVTYKMLKMSLLLRLRMRRLGALRDSYVVTYQATSYGGNALRDSTFAHFQSVGAKGGGGYRGVGSSGSTSWH